MTSRGTRGLPLLFWLGLMAALLVIPALGVSLVLIQRTAAFEQQSIEQKVLQIARDLAQDIDRDLTGITTTLKVLASLPELREGKYGEFHARASATLMDSGLFVLYRDLTGQQILNTRLPWGAPLPLEILPDIDAAARKSSDPYVSNLIIGAVAKRPVYTVTLPIRADGELRGTLIMSLNPERLRNVMREQALGPGWNTGVTDTSGLVLARLHKHEQFLGTPLPPELRKATLDNLDRAFVATSLEGDRIMRAGTVPRLAPWLVTANVSMEVAEAPLRDTRRLLWLMGVSLIAASLLATAMLSRTLAHAIGSIERASQSLADDGELTAASTPVAEANSVGERLRAASRLLRQRAEDLEAVNARIRIALKGADIVVFTQDRTRRYDWVGSGTGDAAARLVGKRDEDHLPPSALSAVVPLKERTLATGEGGEVTYQAGDQTFRLRVEPVLDNGKVTGLIGVTLDVTREHADQQSIRFLLEEVAHRSKNMLTLVGSIAAQTMRHSAHPAEFQARFSDRLQGLARSQDMMLHQGAFACDLLQLVNSQMAAFGGHDGARIRATGPDVVLTAAATQSIGMALHELATNSTKHGALSTPEGCIAITWDLAPSNPGAGDGVFSLSWRETNGPPVSAPERRGFGTLVITRLIEHSLMGKVDLNYAAGGLAWSISAPAGRVLTTRAAAASGTPTPGGIELGT